MYGKQTIILENETVLISNDKLFHVNYRLAFLAIYLILLGNGIVLIQKWNSLNEYEIFLCAGLLTAGVIGFIMEIFFKTYCKTFSFQEIKNIKKQRSIFRFNRHIIRIWFKNGKFQDVYTDSQNENLLLKLRDNLLAL